jgi:phosphatidylserine decarboxylase
MIKIHKEGYPLIIMYTALLLGVFVLVEIIFPYRGFIHYLFYLACIVSLLFVAAFFRLPTRIIDESKGIILSPCDGKVVVIEKVFEKEFFNEERIQVSIFMSPFNVHVNWYPIAGLVKYFNYQPGKYLVAWHPKSSADNERTTVVVENGHEQAVLIRQIAGAVARRVVCYSKENTEVCQGAEMGFIKFGSRVDLLLPLDAIIEVGLDQKVTGKKTVIGRLNNQVSTLL